MPIYFPLTFIIRHFFLIWQVSYPLDRMERKGLKTLDAFRKYILIYSFKLDKLPNFLVFYLIRDQYDFFYLIGIYIYMKLGIFGDTISSYQGYKS